MFKRLLRKCNFHEKKISLPKLFPSSERHINSLKNMVDEHDSKLGHAFLNAI